jgi:hypothetical protein
VTVGLAISVGLFEVAVTGERLRLAAARRDAREVHRLLRGVLVDVHVSGVGERRRIVDRKYLQGDSGIVRLRRAAAVAPDR